MPSTIPCLARFLHNWRGWWRGSSALHVATGVVSSSSLSRIVLLSPPTKQCSADLTAGLTIREGGSDDLGVMPGGNAALSSVALQH
jgi:hypothetical protein